MPRVTDEHRATMKQRIMDAALAVAARKGLGATTMAEIIAESGLSAGAIYGYYKGKDQIVLDIGQEILGDRRDVLVELTARDELPSPVEVLATLATGLPQDLVDSGLVLQFWGAGMGAPDLRGQALTNATQMLDAMTAYLARWLESCGVDAPTARKRAELVTPAFAALVQGYVVQRSMGMAVQADRYLDGVQALLEGGVLAAAEGVGPRA